MRKPIVLAILLFAVAVVPADAGQETTVSAGVGGVFPAGTVFSGVPVSALEAGFGLEIEDGTALGEFFVALLGTSVTGSPQTITLTGKATAGTRTADNTATFSGTVTVDLGTGVAPTVGVPFTATVVVGADDRGTLGLVVGTTTLPNATIDTGSMTVSVPATVTP
ncbi:MAG TPA: hypothetical protein VFT12_10165 [Thermoanaerobaculia bacterium]|nr:hypothetical protein [Thermoanaerobaculia bacterium]